MNLNPFDIRTILLAKHAVLIHFPIALCMTAVAFDYLAQWKKSPALASAAFFNISIAAAFTVPVVATGLMAWQWALEGQKLKGILLLHLVLGCFSSVLIWVVFSMHFGARRHPERPLSKYRLLLEAATVLLMGLTAHLGGFLSGVNS
jgi:uncharacterized membrane protein